MRVIIRDWNLTVRRCFDQSDGVPAIGQHITLKEGRYKVVDVTWMYDLNYPNVTVEIEEDPWTEEPR